jgi:hypothetical protein
LSTRLDLLSEEDCELLATIPDRGRPVPFSEVTGLVTSQIGLSLREVFQVVEPEPYESRLLFNSYGAVLCSGEEVCLRVRRRELEGSIKFHLDPSRLKHVPPVLKRWLISESVISEFDDELRLRLDFTSEASTFESLLQDSYDLPGLWSPKVYRDLCRPALLVIERSRATTLSSLIAVSLGQAKSVPPQPVPESACQSDPLPQSLIRGWLQLALFGRRFPTDFCPDDVVVLADTRLGWTGGTFATTSTSVKENIWKYLLAAALDEPDECYRQLMKLTYEEHAEPRDKDLLSALRQVVVFRQPDDNPLHCDLTLRLLRQLQLLREAGYKPIDPLVQFYRGLFSTLDAEHKMGTGSEPLSAAIEEVWAQAILTPFRQVLRFDRLTDRLAKWSIAMFAFPSTVDQFLDTEHNEATPPDRSRQLERQGDSRSLSAILLLTTVIILTKTSALPIPAEWVDRVTFAACCLIGLIFLRQAGSK